MLRNREQLDFIPGVVPAGQVNHHYVPTIPPSDTATTHKQSRQNSIIFLNYPRAVVLKIALHSILTLAAIKPFQSDPHQITQTIVKEIPTVLVTFVSL